MEKEAHRMLNKKTEFVAKCRHERKYMLEQIQNENKIPSSTNIEKIGKIDVKDCKIQLGKKLTV